MNKKQQSSEYALTLLSLMIDDIHALVANSEVNDAVAEKLLALAYWLEAELEGENK
jgi:hypothetical protein